MLVRLSGKNGEILRLIKEKGITKSHNTVRMREFVAVSIIVGHDPRRDCLTKLTGSQGTIWILKAHSTLRISLFEKWLGPQRS